MNKIPVLTFAILCDEVSIENGKYTFKGLFDRINAISFPAIHRNAIIATRWSNGTGVDYKQHIIVRDRETKEVLLDSTALEQPFSLPTLESMHTITGSMELTFAKECNCVVEIYLNGVKQETELYFQVAKVNDSVGSRIVQHLTPQA